MGKRSNFERKERDFYPTPLKAVVPLVCYLRTAYKNHRRFNYIEPCVGNGDLIEHFQKLSNEKQNYHNCFKSDITSGLDATKTDYSKHTKMSKVDFFITNPPWSRNILHPIIENLRKQKSTWLLFDADWMHTQQSKEYIKYCSTIISVGRVKWIPGTRNTGKDNCCWYLFEKTVPLFTVFIGRTGSNLLNI